MIAEVLHLSPREQEELTAEEFMQAVDFVEDLRAKLEEAD